MRTLHPDDALRHPRYLAASWSLGMCTTVLCCRNALAEHWRFGVLCIGDSDWYSVLITCAPVSGWEQRRHRIDAAPHSGCPNSPANSARISGEAQYILCFFPLVRVRFAVFNRYPKEGLRVTPITGHYNQFICIACGAVSVRQHFGHKLHSPVRVN